MLVTGLSRGPLVFRFTRQEMKYATLRRRFDVKFKDDGEKRIVTFCAFRPVKGEQDDWPFTWFLGISILHPGDRFNSFLGEKLAMKDAFLANPLLTDHDKELIEAARLRRVQRIIEHQKKEFAFFGVSL
jgi:hypothetical protein